MTLQNSKIEYISNSLLCDIRCIIFDFDGTISTLRYGWEEVMKEYMYEVISKKEDSLDEKLMKEIKSYIDESMGIQTIYQMQWLKERVILEGVNSPLDIWEYKLGYNDRLMEIVRTKTKKLISKELTPENFRIKGSLDFIKALHNEGFKLYIASGTDHEDVVNEMKALEIFEYFEDVKGAPSNKIDCPKEAIVSHLMKDLNYKGNQIAVIGDGKVEIEIADRIGGKSIGMATEESNSVCINQRKRKKLIKAGANIIIPNFDERKVLISWLQGVKSTENN